MGFAQPNIVSYKAKIHNFFFLIWAYLIFPVHLTNISTLFYFALLILHALSISAVAKTMAKEADAEELESHFNIRLSWQRSQFGAFSMGHMEALHKEHQITSLQSSLSTSTHRYKFGPTLITMHKRAFFCPFSCPLLTWFIAEPQTSFFKGCLF